MDYELIDFQVKGDETGSLVAIEGMRNIPFEVKRVYYIYGTTSSAVRGKHAHRNLQQLIFCPVGSCEFTLDDGVSRRVVRLQRPNQGLYIKSSIWREFSGFSHDCVVMVLASDVYNESDYIRDYQEFLRELRA
jgi:dTDP-4-dehydrorhamnose 3,5-epimerase-like enzyme